MEKIRRKIEKHWQALIILLISLILGLIISLFFLAPSFRGKEINQGTDLIEELMNEDEEDILSEESEASTDKEEQIAESLKEIIVDIKGQVKVPGVYHMEEGSRIIDVIEKAGGLLDESETTAVNFAQLLSDQMVIYVPKIGEDIPVESTISQEIAEGGEQEQSKININEADKEALMTLNGIGDSKAENILAYREENGLFKSIEDIKNVSGIGEATFNNLKDSIVVGY
ncbi:competence protein ComEA [Atopostipes suicloacalis DSM 15692]|uniref:Competence protein ComEA n=1 Tax=Atopostipes suicloacalis DSM 15692 TaxID=1121025 RepID=A0A1M4VWV5_9LACT|nr:helix-hairpin-helix domain-containing protein [Atopostipes suicloacalis]SHE73448.1 competence protein ComEA [Atopostipes suicloacalis DSM 15692]